jgi:hypothetical protein
MGRCDECALLPNAPAIQYRLASGRVSVFPASVNIPRPLKKMAAAAAAALVLGVCARAQIPADIDFAKLYPKTKEEIRTGLAEIAKRHPDPPAPGAKVDTRATAALQAGVNEVNSYRFLCGVPSNVVLDPDLVAKADEAAKACKAAGHIAHDLGHSTGECNLCQGQSNNVAQVRGYIEDSGANNRQVRGHRRWVLNPPLAKTGLGLVSGFGAMHVFDQSGSKATESWAYPGKGWFPRDHFHGDAWSLYLTKDAPPADQLKVTVWRLHGTPQEALKIPLHPNGRELKLKGVFVSGNAINFEPDVVPSHESFWVTVEGPGVSERYLVDFF